MKLVNYFVNIAIVLGIYLMSMQTACAYIDPGTGSLWLQMMLSILLGLIFSIKLYWGKIKNYFKNLRNTQEKMEA